MKALVYAIPGALFGAGLAISGMTITPERNARVALRATGTPAWRS